MFHNHKAWKVHGSETIQADSSQFTGCRVVLETQTMTYIFLQMTPTMGLPGSPKNNKENWRQNWSERVTSGLPK
jgi:hypothetical protein